MTNSTDERSETGTADDWTSEGTYGPGESTPDVGLSAVVVRYSTGQDRCTLVPRDGPPETTLTAWLTADVASVVDLEAMR